MESTATMDQDEFLCRGMRKKGRGHSCKKGNYYGQPLSFQRAGEACSIVDFRGGPGMKRHLDDLGLIKGDEIQVLSQNASGFIISCKGVRMALNNGLAHHIITNTL